MTNTQYHEQFPTSQTKSKIYLEKQSKRIQGKNNPAYGHGGKFSPFSKKFVKGNISKQTTLKAHQSRIQSNTYTTTIEYWLKKTNGNLQEAQKLLKERQTTFSLEKCIEKHGLENGTKIWSKRQQKWCNSYKKQNYSKISQKLFLEIMNHYKSTSVYFATFNKIEMKDYQNKEYRLTLLNGKTILPDFIDISTKKIIEFDGTYWHNQKQANMNREEIRDQMIILSGYQILHVREQDYKQNPQQVIQECINFLTQ